MTEAEDRTACEDRPIRLLALTVGGSSEPLKTALREVRPDRVLFIVSEPAEGQQSSATMVPELCQADGCPSETCMLVVPADNPDRAFALILTRLEKALAKGHEVIADYTGGTKSMSAALVMAARMLGGIALQVTTGKRLDLVKVADGSEQPVRVDDTAVSLRLKLRVAEDLVRSRSYAAALAVLPSSEAAAPLLPKRWRDTLASWRNALAVLELWDRFDHCEAWKFLCDRGGGRAGRLGRWLDGFGLCDRLELLAEAAKAGKPSAALCEDLWWNAQRRAAQGAFDDAVARLYRLAEAAVQAQLSERGIDQTSRVPVERLAPSLRARHGQPGADGTVMLALTDACEQLAHEDPESPVPALWRNGQPSWQGRRNRSILAHGFRPLGADDWREAEQWFEAHAARLWRDLPGGEAARQLPDRLPE